MALRKIAFILEDFRIGSPGQQLLDRFLIGYSRDGEFRKILDAQIAVWLVPASENSTAVAEATAALAETTCARKARLGCGTPWATPRPA